MKNIFVINKGFQCLLLIAALINTAWAQADGNYGFDDEIAQGINKYENPINDEELYNGGYNKRKQSNYDNTPTSGLIRLGIDVNNKDKKSWFDISNKNENTVPDKKYNRFGFDTREESIHDGNDVMGDDAKNGFMKINDHNKPYQPEDDERMTEGAPPPPDTPDVPIKSAWGMALTIGAFFLYIKIKSKL